MLEEKMSNLLKIWLQELIESQAVAGGSDKLDICAREDIYISSSNFVFWRGARDSGAPSIAAAPADGDGDSDN